MEALLRLEGLAKGGAASYAAFPELLHGLRSAVAAQASRLPPAGPHLDKWVHFCREGPFRITAAAQLQEMLAHAQPAQLPSPARAAKLSQLRPDFKVPACTPGRLPALPPPRCLQMQDRRSAVSRQACHAVGVLASACGSGFEPFAVHLLPVVLKTLAMGIQVRSLAASIGCLLNQALYCVLIPHMHLLWQLHDGMPPQGHSAPVCMRPAATPAGTAAGCRHPPAWLPPALPRYNTPHTLACAAPAHDGIRPGAVVALAHMLSFCCHFADCD